MPTPTPAGNDVTRKAVATLDLARADSGVGTFRENRKIPTADGYAQPARTATRKTAVG